LIELYKLLRNLLFCLPAETSHHFALNAMSLGQSLGLLRILAANSKSLSEEKVVMGIRFPHPVGLAAGLDKNADHIQALSKLGFGFIELGTLTPRPQAGNSRPRMFRLSQQQAIINRMGFNNKGIDHAIGRIKDSGFTGIVGVNIGKNADTPVTNAVDDYLIGFRKSYGVASYIAVNLSSPNTPGLRSLQFGDELKRLLGTLKDEQAKLRAHHNRYVPLAVKIAPDLAEDEIAQVCASFLDYEIDGIIATNTTVSRVGVEASPYGNEAGGLSGAPLTDKSTAVIRSIKQIVGDALPIVGVGGIMTSQDAIQKIQAGADLLQLYTGFIYQGPELITQILSSLANAESPVLHH